MESALKLNLDFTLLNDHKDPFQVNDDTLSLQQIIPRLIHEKGQGSFLNITEDELIQEIQKAHDHRGDESIEDNQGEFTEIAGGEPQKEEGQVAEATETQEQAQAEEAQNTGTNSTLSTNELFYKNKHEVLKNIQTALNESSLALDFVSLLISCLRPAAATVSMSAHLKKFVEHGSLNSDRVQDTKTAQMKQEQMKETRSIGLGWKLAALENASGLLRDAGSRLAEEVFKEKIFWDTIKKNLNTKEILFKTRERGTNKRVLAVKFGYSDSGSTYPIEGNAMIKTSNDNNNNTVQFVPMDNRPIFNKSIRVRILARDSSSNADDSDYQIVGESPVSQEMFDAGSSEGDGSGYVSLKAQIEQARYLIFEEELFNQLVEESNSLISYNVRLESESKLTIEVNHQLIEITYQENLPSSELEKEPKPQDQRAELIATYLRLMLTMKHEAYLNAKNQTRILTPNPNSRQTQIQLQQQQQQAQLQAQQQTKKEQTILKPIIGQFRHDFILRKLHTLITRVVSELNQSSSSSNQPIKFLLNRSKYISTTPPISRFKIIIPSRIKSRIFVNLDSFDWTNYLIKVIVCQEGERDQEFVFEDLRSGDIGGGVEGCLEWLISGLI